MITLRIAKIAMVVLVTATLATPGRGASGHLRHVTVNTPYGALRGFRTMVGSQEVDTFLKIPYAAPPTGSLRLRKPNVVQPWTATRDATQMGPMCPQTEWESKNQTLSMMYKLSMDEDCLFLNIYAPQTNARSASLPVMVYIHGGGYFGGSGNLYNGTYLATKGVIVVTINYRLGALGFLSTQVGASVGNYGLWDQIEALKWIRRAISAFKGDPDNITIFGQSAGGGSVSQLIMAMPSRGLFHKAIMQSGVSLSPWAFNHPRDNPSPRELAFRVARKAGCSAQDPSLMVNCLKGKPAMAIVNATTQVQDDLGLRLSFVPDVETTFGEYGLFASVPESILLNDGFSNITAMRGFNHDELSTLIIEDPKNSGVTMEEFRTQMKKEISEGYRDLSQEDQLKIVNIMTDTYVSTPGITDPYQLRHALSDFLTDCWFAAPTLYTQDLLARAPTPPQYMYRFSYRADNSQLAPWQGVTHGAELSFIFGTPYFDDPLDSFLVSSWTDKDRRMADEMMTLWTNFAKYGNPSQRGVLGTTWRPWSNSWRQFMEINSTLSLKSYPLSPQDTWESIYQQLYNSATITGPVIG